MNKHKNKTAKLELLKVRDLITARKNQYSDYYKDFKIKEAGKAKYRPCIILDIYEEQYYLVTFATSQLRKLKINNNKLLKKGSQKITYQNIEFYFNPTDTFIFNKNIMRKNIHAYIGNVSENDEFNNLFSKALEVGQIWNDNNPDLLLQIIDALMSKQFPIADMLIEKQFPDPTKEDIDKRHKIIEEHNEFLKNKKEKS